MNSMGYHFHKINCIFTLARYAQHDPPPFSWFGTACVETTQMEFLMSCNFRKVHATKEMDAKSVFINRNICSSGIYNK
jgi:hypothetical protein